MAQTVMRSAKKLDKREIRICVYDVHCVTRLRPSKMLMELLSLNTLTNSMSPFRPIQTDLETTNPHLLQRSFQALNSSLAMDLPDRDDDIAHLEVDLAFFLLESFGMPQIGNIDRQSTSDCWRELWLDDAWL